jgi:hypothetical protein
MYDKEAATQRPLHPNGAPEAETNRITEANWTSKLGTAKYVHSLDAWDFIA